MPQSAGLADRRESWLSASTAILRQLLLDVGADPLEMIARTVRDIAGAAFVAIVLPTHDGRRVMVEIAVGAEELVGTTYSIDGSLAGRAITTGRSLVHHAGGGHDPAEWRYIPTVARGIGSVVAVPIVGPDGVRGAMCLSRPPESADFVATDVEMATVFANDASVAMEVVDGRERRHRVEILEDRARLAGDLHDHIIQRLFAAALRLEIAITDDDGDVDDLTTEVTSVVASIRDTIGELRNTIAGLRVHEPPVPVTALRRRVERVVDESTVLLSERARLSVDGPLELVTDPRLADDVVAVVRESLSNVGRHARAARVTVTLTTTNEAIAIEVIDDGVGVGTPDRRSGLDHLARRAERRSGAFAVDDVQPGAERPGTRLRWTGRLT